MKKSMEGPGPVRPLTLAVLVTSGLLCAGAFLVVLGIFNESMDWNILPSRVEEIAWGVVFSIVALGGFGVALTMVLGIREIVAIFQAGAMERHPEKTGEAG